METGKASTIAQEIGTLARIRVLQLAALVFLLSLLTWLYCDHQTFALDADLWWHLKVGDWIVANRAVPHNGILTYTATDRPWVAYSWGYEVVVSCVYRLFGLLGVGWFGLGLTLGVALAVFWSVQRLSHRFWLAILLSTLACYAFIFNMQPRPVFVSFILFSVVLTLILEARSQGRIELLYWLPGIFLLWANLHIQFIYGLFLVGLLATLVLAQQALQRAEIAPVWLQPCRLGSLRVWAIFLGCGLAACASPYGPELYQVVVKYSRASFTYQVILELQANDFRSPRHFVQLMLACAGVATVGWQKKIDPFKLILLLIASLVAFRTTRDSWFVCISAAACLGDCARRSEVERSWLQAVREFAASSAGLVVIALLVARNTQFNSKALEQVVRGYFPMDACAFLLRNPQPGALYNTLDWGGFLAFAMPETPIAIDGRNDLFGDEMDRTFYRTQMGMTRPESDPYLQNAGVALVQRAAPLASGLLSDPNFRLVYRDRLAMIFVRQ